MSGACRKVWAGEHGRSLTLTLSKPAQDGPPEYHMQQERSCPYITEKNDFSSFLGGQGFIVGKIHPYKMTASFCKLLVWGRLMDLRVGGLM